MNSTLEIVEENSTDLDWEPVHMYCGQCYSDPEVYGFAFCGESTSGGNPVAGFDASNVCSMCMHTMRGFALDSEGYIICPHGHRRNR